MPNMKLTDRQKNHINAIIGAKTRVALDLEAIKDDVDALAIELGMKASQVNALIATVIAEQTKGGVIEEKGRILDLAEQMVTGSEEDAPADAADFTLEVVAKVNEKLNGKS